MKWPECLAMPALVKPITPGAMTHHAQRLESKPIVSSVPATVHFDVFGDIDIFHASAGFDAWVKGRAPYSSQPCEIPLRPSRTRPAPRDGTTACKTTPTAPARLASSASTNRPKSCTRVPGRDRTKTGRAQTKSLSSMTHKSSFSRHLVARSAQRLYQADSGSGPGLNELSERTSRRSSMKMTAPNAASMVAPAEALRVGEAFVSTSR